MIYKTLRLALWGAAAAVALARPAAAAPTFTPSRAVALSSASVQAVVPIPTGFRMYLTSGPYHVVSATSTDHSTWSFEAGIRLSTGLSTLDTSSITAVGVIKATDPTDGWLMYYVAVDTHGVYRVLSATSTDGLSWGKQAGVRLTNGGGFIGSLSPFQTSEALLRLYYVADQDGLGLSTGYRVHSASSVNGGVALSTEGVALTVNAYAVSATTITGGKTRLYYTAPLLGSTTASQILSATASDGLSFIAESGVRLSTDAAASALLGLVVVRATEPWRWRLFSDYTVNGTTQSIVSHALTVVPVIDTFTPRRTQQGQAAVSYAMTGEVFSPAPSVGFILSLTTFNATTAIRADDTAISGTLSTLNRSAGLYDVAAVNADGQSGRLDNFFEIELPPGQVTILDNLIRPLRGGVSTITVEIFEPGEVTLRLYTVEGGLVATLFQGPMPAGQTALTWNGRTPAGSVVASGVYLLSARGPKLNTVEKIVVIK
ncbi:MAG: hypothetical protein HYZ75_18495 [Elusimicrobia bacterium]|nr:hypothetical protein [Elusimicrobiota bacterium]